MLIGTENIQAFDYTASAGGPEGSNKKLNYYSLYQLYFSAFDPTSGSIINSSSFDNYIESSFIQSTRYLNTQGIVYSIPKSLYGTHLEPGTVVIGSGGTKIYDDGDGLLLSGSMQVGNVIYSHGQLIIMDTGSIMNTVTYTGSFDDFLLTPEVPLSWSANLPIYTSNFVIKVSDFEFNFTHNPTAQSGSFSLYIDELGDEVTSTHLSSSRFVRTTGILADNVTGSAFQPYITTVGLYNDANELLAVGKLAQPLPKPANTELTINIKLDI